MEEISKSTIKKIVDSGIWLRYILSKNKELEERVKKATSHEEFQEIKKEIDEIDVLLNRVGEMFREGEVRKQ